MQRGSKRVSDSATALARQTDVLLLKRSCCRAWIPCLLRKRLRATIDAATVVRGRRRKRRVVVFALRHREVHVRAVRAALVVRSGRPHRRGRAVVLTHQATQVAETVALAEEPERA